MGCGASSTADVEYLNGKPTFEGDEVIKGFNRDNGLLFRIVNNKKQQWAFYNDTKEYEMHVTVTFAEGCDIKALGNTTVTTSENGETIASVVVYPLETEMFIEGTVNGFKSKMDALPLSEDYQARQNGNNNDDDAADDNAAAADDNNNENNDENNNE